MLAENAATSARLRRRALNTAPSMDSVKHAPCSRRLRNPVATMLTTIDGCQSPRLTSLVSPLIAAAVPCDVAVSPQ